MNQEVFAAFENSDKSEGRGVMVLKYVFNTIGLAMTWVDQEPEFRKYLSVLVLTAVPDPNIEIRARALAKLSTVEKKALGLL